MCHLTVKTDFGIYFQIDCDVRLSQVVGLNSSVDFFHVSITGEIAALCRYFIMSLFVAYSYTLLICCVNSIFRSFCVAFTLDRSTIHILVCLSLTQNNDLLLSVKCFICRFWAEDIALYSLSQNYAIDSSDLFLVRGS